MSGATSLEAFIEEVESLRTMNARVAKEAEKGVADVVRKSAAKGTTPDGEPWPERKGGGRALPNAPSAIASATKGTQIVVTVKSPYGFHTRGDGLPRRQILPDPGTIPSSVSEAIGDAAKRVFDKERGT